MKNRVLVTGAGGAAAVTLINALTPRHAVIAAVMDPLAVGLYLVPAESRTLLPRSDAPEFIDVLLEQAILHGVDLVIPTVDSELRAVCEARDRFAVHGNRRYRRRCRRARLLERSSARACRRRRLGRPSVVRDGGHCRAMAVVHGADGTRVGRRRGRIACR